MKRILSISLAIPLLLAAAIDPANAQDQSAADAAAERARIANQRILAETERRNREAAAAEAVQAEAATVAMPARAATVSAQPTAVRPPPERAMTAVPPPSSAETTAEMARPQAATEPAATAPDMTLVLEQIRTLGELKDAGYVTDEEFDRIKKRLLDDTL